MIHRTTRSQSLTLPTTETRDGKGALYWVREALILTHNTRSSGLVVHLSTGAPGAILQTNTRGDVETLRSLRRSFSSTSTSPGMVTGEIPVQPRQTVHETNRAASTFPFPLFPQQVGAPWQNK